MSTINKINVGGTEYEIGDKLYRHNVQINFYKPEVREEGTLISEEVSFALEFEFKTKNSTPITQQEFIDYINNYNWKTFTTTYIYSVIRVGGVGGHLCNNYYGTHNFQVSHWGIGSTNYESISLGTAFTDEYISGYNDSVSDFVVEL